MKESVGIQGPASEVAQNKRRVRRVEKDPRCGWIARDKNGVEYFEEGWRWNSRSVARAVVEEDRALGNRGALRARAEIGQ